jgi:hypothetical protein
MSLAVDFSLIWGPRERVADLPVKGLQDAGGWAWAKWDVPINVSVKASSRAGNIVKGVLVG